MFDELSEFTVEHWRYCVERYRQKQVDFLKNILKQHDMTPEELDPEGQFIKGKILSLNDKGYGFISSTDLEFTKIYFHWSALNRNTVNFKDLKKGMKVEFKLIKLERGYRAIKIQVIENEKND